MKDNNNIETYNIWSGTDYDKNTSGFTKGSNCQINTSNKFSINGENCLEIQRVGDTSFYVDTTRFTDLTADKTITYECIVYSPNSDINIQLRCNGIAQTTIMVPSLIIPQKVSLSCKIPVDNTGYTCLRFLPTSKNSCFIDDITCIVR